MNRYVSLEESKFLPEKCPVCGHTLIWDGVDLKCAFKDCMNIEYSDLQQWCEIIGETDGLAWILMKQYLDKYGIYTLADLYDTKKGDMVIQDLNCRQISITEVKIKEFFENLYYNPINAQKALLALNIPRLGESTVKEVIKTSGLVDNLILSTNKGFISDELQRQLLEVVKDATTKSILFNMGKLKHLQYIKDRIVGKEVENKEIVKVAVTGSLNSMKRDAFKKYIEIYGYELSSAIKSCKYLITNTPDSGSSKNKDAQKYGVEIITEQAFLDLIGGNTKNNSLF